MGFLQCCCWFQFSWAFLLAFWHARSLVLPGWVRGAPTPEPLLDKTNDWSTPSRIQRGEPTSPWGPGIRGACVQGLWPKKRVICWRWLWLEQAQFHNLLEGESEPWKRANLSQKFRFFGSFYSVICWPWLRLEQAQFLNLLEGESEPWKRANLSQKFRFLGSF